MTLKALQAAREEIVTLTAKLAESEAEFKQCSLMLDDAERSIEQLEQQLAEAQRDAERLNWVANNPEEALDIIGRTKEVRWLRYDIDSAMITSKDNP